MKPEDIDKLFKERLGPSSPTPPADLWARLQDRMETEMPAAQQEEQKPRGFMYLSYSIAAAIALLLAVGIVFFSVEKNQEPSAGLAQQDGHTAEQPLLLPEAAEAVSVPGMAQATEPATPGSTGQIGIPEATEPEVKTPAKLDMTARGTIAKAETKPAAKQESPKTGITTTTALATQQVAQVEKPVADVAKKGEYYNTGETVPATFAANTTDMNAQPVEIIIRRAVAVQQVEEEAEESGFEKKQKLAKNIFKQVRNLSNGERVELSELGINTNSIALETQIGKQKISKVIQL